MSAEDKALEETSTHLVDAVLADASDMGDDLEDEFVKSLINSQQRQKTPSPPPVAIVEPAVKEEEPVGIIDTDPFSEQPLSDSFSVEEEKPTTPEPIKEPTPVEPEEPKHVEPEPTPAEPESIFSEDTTATPVSELDSLPQVISKLDELELKNEPVERQESPAHEEPVAEPHFDEPEYKDEPPIWETVPAPVYSDPFEAKRDEPAEEPRHESPEPSPIVIPEVHNKEHIIEPVESEPITSSPFEETPKPEPVREPSPVFQPEERYEPVAPVERPEEKTIIVESVPEAPKSAEPEATTSESVTINAPPASNDDSSSTSRKAKQQDGIFKRVRSHCAII